MRVLIVDDHNLVRAGLSRLLQGFAGIDVIAEARNAEEAIELARLHQPDIVLLDISLPGRSGLEALSVLRAAAAPPQVVMMSMHDDAAHAREALNRGATGFVVKDAGPQELELALQAAHQGQVFLSPQISSKLLGNLLGRDKPARDRPTGVAALPPRQRQILGMIGSGLSTKEIAADLGISIKTVETHRARMMEVLGCRRANELVVFAAQQLRKLG